VIEIVDHELDGLWVFCIHVPAVVDTIDIVAARDIDGASLSLLEVAFGIGFGTTALTAGKTEEL